MPSHWGALSKAQAIFSVWSDDFLKQNNGMILFYSLKNPSYPEYIYSTESGVMCLDFHPEQPYLVCVGFYDGSVAVFNVVENKTGPIYQSTAKTGKHTDPVWQVRIHSDALVSYVPSSQAGCVAVQSVSRDFCW